MLNGLSLRARLSLLLVLIMVAASSLTAFMTLSKFRKVLEERALSTYAFLVVDLQGIVEDGLNLGLALEVLRNNQPLLERRKAGNPGTLGISIHDIDGRILYDTDRFRIGTGVTGDWQAAGALPLASAPRQSGVWWRRTAEGTAVGAPLTNSFGQGVGGIVLRFDSAFVDRSMTEVVLKTVQATLIWAGAGSLAIILIVMLTTGRLLVLFQSMGRDLSDLERADALPSGPGARQDGMARFRHAAAETSRRLARAERLVERIGLSKRDGDGR